MTTHTHNAVRFAVVSTTDGDALLNVDDISHAVAYEQHLIGGEKASGIRVHFKAKGSTHLDLPGISAVRLASALNGDPF